MGICSQGYKEPERLSSLWGNWGQDRSSVKGHKQAILKPILLPQVPSLWCYTVMSLHQLLLGSHGSVRLHCVHKQIFQHSAIIKLKHPENNSFQRNIILGKLIFYKSNHLIFCHIKHLPINRWDPLNMAVPMGWRQGVAKRAANQRCLQERQQKNRAEVRKAEPRTHPRSGSPAWIGEAETQQW